MIKRGMNVHHNLHGDGVVSSVSPDGLYIVVRYTSERGKSYRRTHRVTQVKQLQNQS